MHRKILILDKVMSVLSWCNSFVFMELMTSHVPNFKGTAKLKTEIAGEILKILVYCFFENLIISEVLSCVKSFVSALRWPLNQLTYTVADTWRGNKKHKHSIVQEKTGNVGRDT